ncbi:MAG TPA: hypothetical protein VET48_07435 [Steroidobacteraceae bacterium]|nr:hypothetical protein [Steroidobacteraceae bacterium]
MSDRQPDNFEQRAQALLRDSAERIDGRTRSRLTQARHAALDAIRERQKNPLRWFAPVGAIATAAVVAMIVMNPMRHPLVDPTIAAADELEIVTSEDSLEFYRDVEFYAWLADADDNPAEESGA